MGLPLLRVGCFAREFYGRLLVVDDCSVVVDLEYGGDSFLIDLELLLGCRFLGFVHPEILQTFPPVLVPVQEQACYDVRRPLPWLVLRLDLVLALLGVVDVGARAPS